MNKRFTATAAIVLALAITPALSGCFGNPIEQIVEGATGGDVSLPGQGIPDDFPKDVPLYDGEVTFGLGVGNGDGKAWNVTIRVPGLDAADSIKSQLEGAGFAQNEAGVGGTTADGATLIYGNDKYTVLVVITKDDTGFVANYTVSDVTSN
ncbi:MAG: hypothetical protein BGO97_02135 [Micrococcales bacterium 70-64]|nr:hypothetical protein [Leifsonia sp.]ODU66004.1 MAG: hypothetical protein ABT06_02140 [Leifsonia sp. SCN 70-46]OJX84630.1 MAG: hypothetical protein BGO97_02135 [Micrococcales bacterium 70-64]